MPDYFKYYERTNTWSGPLINTDDIPDSAWSHIRLTQEEFLPYRNALAEIQEDRREYENFNATLLRINKERANKDRKLHPVKQHSGYVVLSSSERDHTYKGPNYTTMMVRVWETTLQTPYSVDFSYSQTRKLCNELFVSDEEGCWKIQKIGINGRFPKGYAELSKKPPEEAWDKHNTVFDIRFKANYRSGYWEMIMLHTKPLSVVPPEFRYQEKEKKEE